MPRAKKITEAPVGTYKDRPLEEALADPEHTAAVEDRQPDQIADYHAKHPTLKRSKTEEKAISDAVPQGEV